MSIKGVAALNVYKKVDIIRRSTDVLTYEDAEGNTKSISDLHLAAVTTTPNLKVKKTKNDIPVPKIKDVKSYKTDISATFQKPISFVRYQRPSAQSFKEKTEYLVDAEDEAWLLNNTKFGGSIPDPRVIDRERNNNTDIKTEVSAPNSAPADTPEPKSRKRSLDQREKQHPTQQQQQQQPKKTCELPLFMFEIMIDVLEKATAFDTIIRKDQAELQLLERLPELYHMYPVKAATGVVKIKDVLNDVYNYWVSKRSKLKRPLMRRFWPVTSSDDTNPHLVFRPREKEKYKLRKKRQNDMDAYRKLQQLKHDFEHLRELIGLVKKREELNQSFILLQKEWFHQKLYDYVDTSGFPRESKSASKKELDSLLELEEPFDLRGGRRVRRTAASRVRNSAMSGEMMMMLSQGTTHAPPKVIAGQNHGEPAPNFLQPLETREEYVTSWNLAVPHVTSFVDSHPEPTFRYRHRSRVGRGGRVIIDRLPLPPNPDATTFFRATGEPTDLQVQKQGPLDILPPALDYDSLRSRVDTIAMTALQEEYDDMAKRPPPVKGAAPLVDEENDGDVVVVSSRDWLNTDEQLWGEERYALGPI